MGGHTGSAIAPCSYQRWFTRNMVIDTHRCFYWLIVYSLGEELANDAVIIHGVQTQAIASQQL
jgi:hypothetical protein